MPLAIYSFLSGQSFEKLDCEKSFVTCTIRKLLMTHKPNERPRNNPIRYIKSIKNI